MNLIIILRLDISKIQFLYTNLSFNYYYYLLFYLYIIYFYK